VTPYDTNKREDRILIFQIVRKPDLYCK